jgi:carbon-monoxide dehydrogenase large subunit
MTHVGSRARRVEDGRLLRGAGRFVDDLSSFGQLHLRVARSASAHARLVRVGLDAARELPGVHVALAAADLPELPPIPLRLGPFDEPLEDHLQPILARDEVRYVGEPVAVVLAEDPYLAEDAAELVEIELDPLDVVLDARAAAGTPAEACTLERGYGDVEAAFAAAAHTVAVEVRVGRHSAVPLEPRGLLADHDRGTDTLTLWGATKVPHWNRQALATMLEMPLHRVVIRAVDAGGGFGARGELYPEDVLVALLARRLGRPVKWIEDRAEHLVAVNHSREQSRRLEGAFDADGALLALRDEVFHDNGAYVRTHGVVVPELTLGMLAGPYRVPAYVGSVHVALTHKTPCGTYRAPGRYEATLARERLLDVAAAEIGIDRIDLRRHNLLRPDELPHRRDVPVLGHTVEIAEGDFPSLLERALEAAGFNAWTEEAQRARDAGRLVGAGLACLLEKSGGGGYESARVDVDPTGAVRVASGGTSLGQGIETTLALVAADELGVAPDTIDVVCGDTELVPDGMGSWASRSTIFAGSAVKLAAAETADKARRVAADLLEAAPADLRLRDGRVTVAGSEDRAVTLGEVADACDPVRAAARGEEPGLGAGHAFTGAPMTYPFGVHLCLVEVDAQTGGVEVLRYLVLYDVGRAINPAQVEGQIAGGAAQGLGGALFEEFRYDEQGQPQATSFMDYLMPTAAEVPSVQTVICEATPARGNPLGVRGAGEAGTTAAGAAVASAVGDALGAPAAVRELPLSPERVRALVSEHARPRTPAG